MMYGVWIGLDLLRIGFTVRLVKSQQISGSIKENNVQTSWLTVSFSRRTLVSVWMCDAEIKQSLFALIHVPCVSHQVRVKSTLMVSAASRHTSWRRRTRRPCRRNWRKPSVFMTEKVNSE